jgi:hypothetical protein
MKIVILYRFMSETVGFADSNIDVTILVYFIRKQLIGPREFRAPSGILLMLLMAIFG